MVTAAESTYSSPYTFGFMKSSNTSDTGVLLASCITTAINQRAEDIKGAFDSAWWRGLLVHLHSIGFRDKVISLFESYLSNQLIRVVAPLERLIYTT